MTYQQIKDQIASDYNNVVSARSIGERGGRLREFYHDFFNALEELHRASGPFIVDKESFIAHIRYLKDRVSPGVYDAMLTYCKDTLKLDI